MILIKIKAKGQITLPHVIREHMGLRVGDLLIATIEKGKIILVPQSLVDRELTLSLEDAK